MGRRVAERTDAVFFDTGALYRALTVAAALRGVSQRDGPALGTLATSCEMQLTSEPGGRLGYRLILDGRDVTDDLHRPAVDRAVSDVSAHGSVRDALLQRQRDLASRGRVVVVGRDIGTVVIPDADLKVFLAASSAERARRRFRERLRTGHAESYSIVHAEVIARDTFDSARSQAPLAVAPTAVVVDTDDCDIDGVVSHLCKLIFQWPDALTTGGGEAPCIAADSAGVDTSPC